MSSTKNTLCDACGKSLPGKGSLTQWIGLDICKCAIASSDTAVDSQAPEKKDEVCLSCGRNKARDTGSITQWVFRTSLCQCKPEEKAQPVTEAQANDPVSLLAGEPSSDRLLGHHYQVIDSIGSGGMSEVYKARHQFLGSTVAIKVLPKERAADTRTLMRFQQEAKSVSRLEHPNIVKLREFGVDDEKRPFLVMDYVDGKSLAEVLDNEGALKPTRVAKILQKIADALSHAHSRAVIHRDLKPNNIIIFTDEQGENIKVVDFGIAKVNEEEGDRRDLTQTGEIFGSPYYMSPEQCKGQKLDERSDIYSFGCLIFELLTGEPAAKAESVVETLMIHVNGFSPNFADSIAFKRISEEAASESSEKRRELTTWHGLVQVARGCLKLDKEDRYGSMESIKKELDLIGGGNQPRGPRRNLVDTSGLSSRLSSFLPQDKTGAKGSLTPRDCLALVSIGAGIVLLTTTVLSSISSGTTSTTTQKDENAQPVITEVADAMGTRDRYVIARSLTSNARTRVDLTPESMKQLNSQQFDDIEIRSTHVTDSDLSILKDLSKMETLSLSGSFGFSADGLLNLKNLSRLKTIDVSGAEVKDEHALALSKIPIESLNLAYTSVTDECLPALNAAKTLKAISFAGTYLSTKGFAELEQWGWKKDGRWHRR